MDMEGKNKDNHKFCLVYFIKLHVLNISQSLTNLMLCGIATSNVFDGDKCLEGLGKFHFVESENE